MSESNQYDERAGDADTDVFAGEESEVYLQTEPLLPLWFAVTLYAVFGGLVLMAAIWVPIKWVQQHRTFRYLRAVHGPWEEQAPALDSEELISIREFFASHPRYSLLFLNQELVRDPIDDERMAKAEALRKALGWEEDAIIRDMLDELLDNMDGDGAMPPDYELPQMYHEPLKKLINWRREHWDESYEARQVTEVLEWIQQGRPTRAVGPERRRLSILRDSYDKRLFVGADRRMLRRLAREWEESDSPAKRGLAGKFENMLDEEYVVMTAEEEKLCEELIEDLEASYLKGRERLAQIVAEMVAIIEEEDVFIDHPQVYELCYLLKEEHPPAAENIKDALFRLRRNKFTLRFLGYVLRQDTINPVLAVETERLTADEHRAMLRHENTVRRQAAMEVMERIALDFYENRFLIRGVQAEDREDYVIRYTVTALGRVGEDPDIGADARTILNRLRRDCPDWF